MKSLKFFLLFLVINFSALGLGVFLMGDGATSQWYTSLNQAPWTPPNWMFGAAWTLIMLCFSLYMALLYLKQPTKKVITLFALQVVLNVAWNFVFFNQYQLFIGFIIITALTFIITVFLVTYFKVMKIKNILILPYVIWIFVATSLNLYILINN
ncbi:TspO/MBR related protein [Gelidibacter sediminis]|uniref:TspO/MBR related protein n=1 Tax=Gelidibacter sediminis TaxID=1608710 RepID=A0A4R7PZG3_9FLAO|nr:TspO/MBR family protein [Gelidibacter sediminis]TDU39832.1 TspO/MBR related protein [Gelidibacter sediminis]